MDWVDMSCKQCEKKDHIIEALSQEIMQWYGDHPNADQTPEQYVQSLIEDVK